MNRILSLVLIVNLLIGLVSGCSPKTGTGSAKVNDLAAKTDPWPAAAAMLRRQPDLGGTRQAFAHLTSELADNPDFEKPESLTADAAAAVGQQLRLTPEEIREISGSNFTSLDGAYVVECLILRDALRSLDLGNLPVEQKLQRVFDWVCRQVYLRPGSLIGPKGPTGCPPIPPQYAIIRGYGTGLERAYLFLAILRQMGIDGCLIGPPERETSPGYDLANLSNPTPAKGPFWAVGARLDDGNVLLFDPWRGESFPGSEGKIGTLAQAIAGGDVFKSWLENKDQPWDVSPSDLKAATVYVALPYSAAAIRLKTLESKLMQEVGVKLYREPAALMKSFGSQARWWAPPVERDRFCLTRVLASFLPLEEGGTDTSSTRELRIYDQVLKLAPIPLELFSPPAEIGSAEVRNALRTYFIRRFSELLMDSNPRERIARGQYNEVIRTMVERERQFGMARERSRQTEQSDSTVASWSEKANELYQKLSIARLPQNQATLPEVESEIEQMWQKGGPVVQYIEARRMLPICAMEVGYLLAICKHEQAERTSIRLSRLTEKDSGYKDTLASSKDSWLVAKDTWDRYFTVAEPFQAADPARTAHAKRLAARAERLAKNPKAE